MSEVHHSRRRFLVAIAAGGATVAVGGAGVLVANVRGRSSYKDAVSATWRLGESGDLPLSSSR